MVVNDKAWSDSLTALVRQLYHSSKASVKQISAPDAAPWDSGVSASARATVIGSREPYFAVFSSPFSSRMLCEEAGLGSDFKNA